MVMENTEQRPPQLNRHSTKALPVAMKMNDTNYRHVMQGHFDDLPQVDTKVIRIFISSTFSDMACERNELMKSVYPMLKDYCREKHGMEFQVIDMRWGVRSERRLDHKGPLLCYQEVLNCQSLSMGPSFIVMLGQRYGGHPPPPSIDTHEFKTLVNVLDQMGESTQVLHDWYKCDENNIPPIHSLKPIVEQEETEDEELLVAANMEWWEAETRILVLLHMGASAAVEKGLLDQEEASKFFASVTENEIRLGIFTAPPRIKKYAIAFIRKIEDINVNMKHPKIVKFLDCKETVVDGKIQNAVDENLQNMMQVLKDQKIADHLPECNIHNYTVEFKEGIAETHHEDYLSRFSKDFFERTKNLIDASLRERSIYADDENYNEVLQHSDTCVRYVRQFQGRVEIIEKIRSYIDSNNNQPFVVFGASGSGKTSILGKAASLSLSWLPEEHRDSAIVVLRFLGTSPATSSISQTMKSVCIQLALFVGEQELEHARSLEDFKVIVNTFYDLLAQISRLSKKVLIFLDSLDQLDSSSGAYHLTWLRTKLPPNIKLVVSTLPDMYDILATLRLKLTSAACYAEVKPLEQELCQSILKSLLHEKGRDLSPSQWDIANQAFVKCSLPIFVHLVFHQVLSWKSYEPSHVLRIENTVRGAISQLFRNLESKHGKVLTAHALSYITASRNGLSESELEDLLSLDDDVLRDVFEFHLPPLIRIPPLCWSRLRQDVGSYLVEREADNTRVLYWYHRQFIEVAREYFLSDVQFRRLIHSRMADYFLGLWGGGKMKPFRYPDKLVKKLKLPPISDEDRITPTQPYILEETEVRTRFNLRKLNELPYHLVLSHRMSEFNDYVVFDFDFLLNKLRGTSRYLLLRDLELPEEEGVENIPEAQFVYRALRLAAFTLVSDPTNLVVDLLGRLMYFEEQFPRVRLLLQQVRRYGPEHCCLIPTRQCFESGSGALSTTFDVGLSMGIVLHDGLIAVISLVANEIEIYDVNGNHLKTFVTDHNVFLGLKYLLRLMPLQKSVYNIVVYGPMVSNAKALEELEASWEAHYAKVTEEDCANFPPTPSSLEKDETEKDVEEKEATEEMEKEKNKPSATETGEVAEKEVKEEKETPKEKDEEEEKMDAEEEIDESIRPIDVIRINFSSGNVDVLWRLPPKLRKNIALDDVDFVGDRFIVKLPKKYKTNMVVYDINEQMLVFERNDVFLWASDISNDERLAYWSSQERTDSHCTITFRDMETGDEYVYAPEKEPCWQPLWIVYLQNEVNIFWVANNDKRNPFLQVLRTDRILGSSDEKRFEIEHEAQLEQLESWELLGGTQGHGNREMMRSRFVSHDSSKCVILYNAKNHFPGFIWNKLNRRWVPLDDRVIEADVKKEIALSWGDGTQAFFPPHHNILITTATKTLMIVWSVENGQLLRIIRHGTAEGLLGGEIEDRFVLFHFPDESQGDTEKMFIMAKFYNLDFICKSESKSENEEDLSLPIFKHADASSLYSSLLSPNLLIYENKKDGVIFDLEKYESIYRGPLHRDLLKIPEEAKTNLPPEYAKFVQVEKKMIPAKELWKQPVPEDDSAAITTTDSEMPTSDSKLTDDNVPNSESSEKEEMPFNEKLCFGSDGRMRFDNGKTYLNPEIARSCASSTWLATFNTKKDPLCLFDEERMVFIFLKAPRTNCVSVNFTDATMKRVVWSTSLKTDDFYDEDGTSLNIRGVHLYRRPGHPHQALVTIIRKSEFVERTKIGKSLLWQGRVSIIDYAAIKAEDNYDENRAAEMGLTVTSGPLFDCGPFLHFMSDGCHAINYRLHVYDFVSGEKKREIVIDEPDFLFVNSFLSVDETFVLGFSIRRPYPVEFEIDERVDEDETVAEEPPRNLQIYRLVDGKRLANYVFEVDPSTVFLAKDGKHLIVACHNQPLLMFKLEFDSVRPLTTRGTRRPHTGRLLARCPSRGPKRSYLSDLGFLPLLSQAMSEVVEVRPADPIAFLASFLKKEGEKQRAVVEEEKENTETGTPPQVK